MYQYGDIQALHLEVTSKCNARCPMCLRTVSGGKVNPQLPLTELSLEDIKSFFPAHFIRQLKRMYMCGNYGDPMVAKDTLEIFKYFREIHPQIRLSMFTNGSGRSEQWWQELAKVIDVCRFAIDGLGETNEIYRRKTNFETIMKSAEAFIGAGGTAEWDFIVFKHNEHQIEEAKALSQKMGFQQIQFKKTARFFSYSQGSTKDAQDVLDEKGGVEYQLFPPTNPQFQNAVLAQEELKDSTRFVRHLEQTPISCKTQAEKSIYVSAEGLLFPCCWTGLRLYPWYTEPQGDQIWKWINSLENGKDSLSLYHRSLRVILEDEFFQKKLPQSWQKGNLKTQRLKVCAKTCGQKYDLFQSQFI